MAGKKKEVKEKPLEKMTATELRTLAMEIPGITGVHGMNKNELISEIRNARGISEDSDKKSSGKGTSTGFKGDPTKQYGGWH